MLAAAIVAAANCLVVDSPQDAPASILEVYISSPAPNANAGGRNNNASNNDSSSNGPEGPQGGEAEEEGDAQRQRQRQQGRSSGEGLRGADRVDGGVLVLQARSRRETLLWAKVLQVKEGRKPFELFHLSCLD